MSALLVSVIVPTRDRIDDLRRCLKALAAQEFPRELYEVIVCDDGSAAELGALLAQTAPTGMTLKYLRQRPKGPAAARNLGIRQARGEVVAMTDSDALPDSLWLQKLWEALGANPDAVGVEGKVYADNEGEFDPLGEGPTNLAGGVYLTCNCAYRRAVLLQAGGFDETFPYPAYEDTELAARVQAFGRIVWQPEAIVIHPQRPLTLKAVLSKLRHWKYVLLVGRRYGYLAWKKYPVKYPRWRVLLLAVIALPLAKFKLALRWLSRRPRAALKLMLFGVAEACGALVLVAPMILSSNYSGTIERRNYLETETA